MNRRDFIAGLGAAAWPVVAQASSLVAVMVKRAETNRRRDL
jgi:hypothetical protein